MLDEVYEKQQRDFVVFHIVVPEEIALQRLLHRAICPACGSTYNADQHPDMLCPLDNTILVKRHDDSSEESIRERFSLFYSETKRIIDGYTASGRVVEIDGTKGVDEVTKEILLHLASTH